MTGKVLLSRPKDRSFEAFKAWFQEFVKHLTGREELDGTVTDESLRKLWKKFWAAAEEKGEEGQK